MLGTPSNPNILPPASSTIICKGARSQGEAVGSIQKSANPDATIMASGAPPRLRTAPNSWMGLWSFSLNGSESSLFILVRHKTDSANDVLADVCIGTPFLNAPPPLDAL